MPVRSAVRPTQRRSIVVLAALAVAALAVLPSQSGAVHAARTSDQPKPTVVIEHGAWADGSSWAGVVQRLQRAGYTVDVPPNPLRGLPIDDAYLATSSRRSPVPSSWSDTPTAVAVITNAATGNVNVKALVYVDAFIPDQGETLGQLAGAQPGSCVGSQSTHRLQLRAVLRRSSQGR